MSRVNVSDVGSLSEAVDLFEDRAEEAEADAAEYANPEIERQRGITQRERLKQLHEAQGRADAYRVATYVLRTTLDRVAPDG